MHCRLCKSGNLVLYYTQGNNDEYPFYKCPRCGLINLDLGSTDLTQNQHKYGMDDRDPREESANPGSFRTWRYLRKHLSQPGRLLDIGCGNGSLLYFAARDGWRVQGLELLPELAARVQATLGYRVDVANFMEYSDFSERFELVSLRHVLEHIPDSLLAMRTINRLLHDGGHAVLEFPNIEGISFRFKRAMTRLGLYRKSYRPDYVPGHCNEFSRRSFSYLASATGFSLIDWQTYSSTPAYDALYSRLPVGTKARVLVRKLQT